jgi:hypothetical protein
MLNPAKIQAPLDYLCHARNLAFTYWLIPIPSFLNSLASHQNSNPNSTVLGG